MKNWWIIITIIVILILIAGFFLLSKIGNTEGNTRGAKETTTKGSVEESSTVKTGGSPSIPPVLPE